MLDQVIAIPPSRAGKDFIVRARTVLYPKPPPTLAHPRGHVVYLLCVGGQTRGSSSGVASHRTRACTPSSDWSQQLGWAPPKPQHISWRRGYTACEQRQRAICQGARHVSLVPLSVVVVVKAAAASRVSHGVAGRPAGRDMCRLWLPCLPCWCYVRTMPLRNNLESGGLPAASAGGRLRGVRGRGSIGRVSVVVGPPSRTLSDACPFAT